jgi:dihydrofolate synthase/folylpolyglutamate synthase
LKPEAFLASLINYEKIAKPDYDFKLDNFKKFLSSIQNPEQKLNNVILIAGTKGKGSTATFIESGLCACGLRTALYTSPHLLTLTERIQVNHRPISQKDLSRLIKRIQVQAEKYRITFFEAITAIAFLYSLEKKVDYTILEVGLGGRLDATNVTNPKVSVITRIGYDHINILGRTLTKIAQEKAGIIHPKSFVVISQQKPTALNTILKKINSIKNKYYYTADNLEVKDVVCDLSGSRFTLKEHYKTIDSYQIRSLGKHQIENVLTSWAVLNHLKIRDKRITDIGIKKGLANAQISGRCQIISRKPLTIIDSAHNPESIRSLRDVIKDIIKHTPIIVFGASQGKLVRKILDILSPIAQKFILTQSQNPRHISVKDLALICKQKHISFEISESVIKAIKLARQLSKNKIPIVITGSFYIAGETLAYYRNIKN